MKQTKLVVTLFAGLCGVFAGCTETPDRLERALHMAGENRPELERVLTHYADDSLKLHAARFLIENMPAHRSYSDRSIERYYDAVDSVVRNMPVRSNSIEQIAHAIDTLWRQRGKHYPTVADVAVVKADFLIANIDEAFRQWRRGEWATHVSFADFCEYLLPYKGDELQPLDDWRHYLRNRYSEGLDKLAYCYPYEHSALWATHCVNTHLRDSLAPNIYGFEGPTIHRLNSKLQMPLGVCRDYVEIATAVLRSEGIPVAVDFTPQWPFAPMGHSWNVLLANNGRNIPFGGCESDPGEPHKLDEKMAKVYRKTFAIQPEMEALWAAEKEVPASLANLCMKDVTTEYMATSDVERRISGVKGQYAYLGVFGHDRWTPVAFAPLRGDKVLFKDMGRNVLYMPMAYTGRGVEPVARPFILTAKGEVREIVPDTTLRKSVRLYRKHPLFPHVQRIADRMIGGKLQAANRSDFADSVTVHEISEWGWRGVEVEVPAEVGAYRYWRYWQPVEAGVYQYR